MTTETQTKVIVAEVEPEAVKEVVETQVPGLQGPQGEKGERGTTFTPTVTTAGWVMWTNDGGAKNPSPVCIMGPKGDEGKRGERGEQGEKGETGTFNPDDLKVLQEAKASAETSAATATEQAGIATEKAEALTEAMGSLTTLSNDAVRFTAQEKTDAEKYQARKNIAASSAGEVEALKKQVANLQAQAEGKTFTYETDANEAYSKDVAEGVYPYAAVKNFGGKTIVWNQLCTLRETNIGEISGISFDVDREKGTVRIKGTATAEVFTYVAGFLGAVSANSKVLISYSLNEFPTGVSGIVTDNVNDGNSFLGIPALSVQTVKISSKRFLLYLKIGTGVSVDFTVRPVCFNLTQMFGAGNEPTAKEFLQMFPEDYYEYSAGELKSALLNNLKIRGQNILPTDLEFTQSSSSSSSSVSVTRHNDGSITLNGTVAATFAMKGSFPEVEGNYQGKSLTISSGNPLPSGVWLSWGNGTPMIVGDGSRTSSLAIGSMGNNGNCFYLYANSGSIFNKLRIYPMLTAYREEKEYKPYSLNVQQIPQAVLNLEGYGWSAGTAKNWVDWEKKEYHREVASVDLGTLNWEKSRNYFLCIVPGGAYSNSIEQKGFISPKYEKSSEHYTNGDKTYAFGTGYEGFGKCYLEIEDSAYDTPVSFKKSLKGVICYYELAEPEIIDISDILPDDNLIEVEEGGTITFENSNGDGFRIPVPSEIVYQKKVTTNE